MKVVLITGCSSGIGFSTANLLAERGFKVYATMRDISKNNFNHELIDVVELDVNSEQSVENAIKTIFEKEHRIDVLVNNAGYGLIGTVEDMEIDELKNQFETDFIGAVRTMKKIIPIMREQKDGKIINISSIAGQMGFPLTSAYAASKYALEGFTDSLRQELSQTGISLCLIEPGVVKSKFLSNMKIVKNTKENGDAFKMKKQAELMFERGTKTEVVAEKILHVINSDEIEPRYVVGEDAELLIENKKRMNGLEFEKSIQELFKDVMTFTD